MAFLRVFAEGRMRVSYLVRGGVGGGGVVVGDVRSEMEVEVKKESSAEGEEEGEGRVRKSRVESVSVLLMLMYDLGSRVRLIEV